MAISIADIDTAAAQYAATHNVLVERVRALQQQIASLKALHLPGIRSATEAASNARDALAARIDGAPHLFERPRTLVIRGIQCGFRSTPEGVTWDDASVVVQRIREHIHRDQAELLIEVTEKPVKKALQRLQADDLRRIGVTLVPSVDQIVARPVADDVDKLVQALLDEAAAEPVAEGA